MKRVVVDTSVLASLAFDEPAAQRWAPAIEGAVLYAPSLLRHEMTAVAVKKCRLDPARAAEILSALASALDSRRGINWMEPNPTDVALLAHATGLTAYDASYLWLAGFVGADLVTADRQLAEAFDAFAAR